VVKFGIGASLDYNGLVDYLKAKGYTEKEMTDSGAVGIGKNGKCYDFLAGRLIIPGIDQFGNVISFCGRIIDNRKDVGKYVNTRETLVFTKGKNLFNINNLKKLKNEKGLSSIIMVEGHMDVISLVQAGFENVVASMGTALTKDQARILKRYAEKILICYDGDFAGQKATVKGLEILKEEGLDVKVVALPDGLDPDDVIKKFGKDGYQGFLDDAKPLIDFKLDIIKRTFDVNTVDGKRKYISSAIKVIRESDSPAEQEDLLKIVRDYTGTTYESLRRELYSADTGAKEDTTVTTDYIEGAGDKVVRAARFVLYSYLFNKAFADVEDVNGVEFVNPVHIEIMHYVREKLESGVSPRFTDLFDMFENSDHAELSLIAEMETDENKNFDQQSYYNDCIRTLKIDCCNRKLEKMTKLFSQETDLTKRREYAKVMARLLAEKNGYTK
jgi:DNA primase